MPNAKISNCCDNCKYDVSVNWDLILLLIIIGTLLCDAHDAKWLVFCVFTLLLVVLLLSLILPQPKPKSVNLICNLLGDSAVFKILMRYIWFMYLCHSVQY